MANQVTKQKSFRDTYLSLPSPKEIPTPKQAWINRIAEVTMKKEITVKCWISGMYQPKALEQSIISKELGVPAEVLFPAKDEMEVEA